jgi:hypothetical protein
MHYITVPDGVKAKASGSDKNVPRGQETSWLTLKTAVC